MAYSFANINLKNTENDSWRLVAASDDSPQTKQRGVLFCLAELQHGSHDKTDVVEQLVTYAISVFSDQTGDVSRPEELLEHLLEETNKRFIELTASMESGSFSDISIIIGILQGENLVLSSHGALEAWLLHPFAKKGAEKSFRWVNILENAKNSGSVASGKLFDQVIAGELAEKQAFIIGTKNLWQILGQDKMKELVLDNRVRRIKQIIIKTISSLPSPTDAALLIGKDEPVKTATKDTVPEVTEVSEEQNSEKITAIAKLFGGSEESTASERAKTIKENKRIETPAAPAVVTATAPEQPRVRNGWFSRLSKKSRVLLILAGVFAVVFIQSIAWINSQNQDEKISIQFDERMQEIQGIRDEAEAKLIYNDKETARTLIMQALALTYDLPQRYAKEEEEKQSLVRELKKTLQEIDGLEIFAELQSVYTFQPDIAPKIVHALIPLRSGLFVVATDSGSLLAVDIATNNAKTIPVEGVSGRVDDAAWDTETNTLYLLTETNEVVEVVLTNFSFDDTSISGEILPFSIADIGNPSTMTFYADRLYAVDSADRQIKRLDLANHSVSNWLSQEETGLGTIIDIVIDSNVYLAAQNEVRQYFKGAVTDWQISGLIPFPSTIVDIHAGIDDEYLYLLDNATKRFIIINKNGVLFKQYTASEFSSPAGFTIHEKGREAYVLDGQTIFRIPINWLSATE